VLEDATVPRSQIPAMIAAIRSIAKKNGLTIGIFGHAGDGNLHPTILCDKRDKEEFKKVEQTVDEIFEHALALQGTLSGEHGIGIAKSKFMKHEVSKTTIEFCRHLKNSLDPNGILNPGKIIGG
jgi:glycolate oxidase